MPMNQLTANEAAVFAHLTLPEFRSIPDVLHKERVETLERLAKASEEQQIRRLQGRAALLEELLELIANAPALATKLNRASR